MRLTTQNPLGLLLLQLQIFTILNLTSTPIPFVAVSQFSAFDQAFVAQASGLQPFLAYPSTLAGLNAALAARENIETPRQLLFERLFIQYKRMRAYKEMEPVLLSLLAPNTFTIITAHQPVVLGGPLFVIYKALSVIKLCQQMQDLHPDKKFLPVFVLGAEDHDFEEINHVQVFGKTFSWQTDAAGSVGKLPTDSLLPLLEELKALLGNSDAATTLFDTINKAYTENFNFEDATQQLLHTWLGPLGMLVVNMNDAELKRAFIPIMEKELFASASIPLVTQTQQALGKLGFKPQAFVRPINLFYLGNRLRTRIERQNDDFVILDTDLRFTEAEMRMELLMYPERFSPNVVLRPLYQEFIFPNLAYVGGGGELAYWTERKSQFEHFGVHYPVLLRRNSALWLSAGEQKKWAAKGFSLQQLFEDNNQLTKLFIAAQENQSFDIEKEKKTLQLLFDGLAAKAKTIEVTLEKAILAEGAKQQTALEQTGLRIQKALKTKHDTGLQQMLNLKSKLFGGGNGLQERSESALALLLQHGFELLPALLEVMDPLAGEMLILNA